MAFHGMAFRNIKLNVLNNIISSGMTTPQLFQEKDEPLSYGTTCATNHNMKQYNIVQSGMD